MLKVLITGAKGLAGSELLKAVPEGFTVIGLGSSELDITNQAAVKAAMAEHQPNLIINAAAYTAVDKAEIEIENAYSVNEQGVAWLATAAKEADIPLFHISTDYVFDGRSNRPYKETDPVNPQSVYGASKLAGEQVLANTLSKYITLRTSWVFGAVGSNFVKTMLRLGKECDELSVVADQHGCPTSARSIAQVLWRLAEMYFKQKDLAWGVYHFSNSPACTWYEFAKEIFNQAVAEGVLDKASVVNAITTADYPTPSKRPTWSTLDCREIKVLIGRKTPKWEIDLKEVITLK